MKKTIATIGVATAAAVSGVGLALAGPSLAQTTTDVEPDAVETQEGTDGTEAEGRRGERSRGDRDGRGCNKVGGEVAEILGLEADEIRSRLDAGETLADIAEAEGVDPDALVEAMVAQATERLDDKVAEGRLTEDEAADKLASKTDRITDKVYGDDDADTDEADA
jgi:hypothetical protein